MVTRSRRTEIARIAAPAAFLLAATIAVLLVRSGLREGDAPAVADNPPVAVTTSEQTVVVRAGDTLEAIAARYGTTVAALRELNPGLDPVGLAVGSRIRVE